MKKKLLCMMLIGLMIAGVGSNVLASPTTEVQKKQNETKKKLEAVNENIAEIENKRKEIRTELSNLNEELVETLLTLEVLEADLEAKKEEIVKAQEEYEQYKALEEEQYQAMKLRIRFMYENAETNYLSLLLSADSISDFLNKADFATDVYRYDEVKLEEYEQTKLLVAEKKVILEEEQAELEEVQEAQEVYKAQLEQQIETAKTQVSNFETELANAQAKAKEYKETIKKQNVEIARLQEEEKKRQEEEEKKNQNTSSGPTTAPSGTGNESAEGTPTATPTEAPKPENNVPVEGSGLGSRIASYAVQFVGNPYVPGGTSLTNGADCSGFTWAVFKHFGISIPRVSVDQAKGGKEVSISNVLPGDIIYYGHHVGIYIGNGKIVHASTQKTGIKISNYTYRTPITVRRYW